MKKIITLFVFMLAFTFNANAQEKISTDELAKKDTYEISQYLGLEGSVLTELQTVFKEKHEVLSTKGISEDRKVILTRFVESKFESLLTADQIAKLKYDQELYKKLTQN